MMRVLFAAFWGLLALSAISQLAQHALDWPLWKIPVSLLCIAWTGGNAWVWAVRS